MTLNIQDIAASVGITATLGGLAFWILSGRFATREQLEAVSKRAEECHTKHDLNSQPIGTLTEAVKQLRTAVENSAAQATERHEALLKALADLHTRTTVLEKTGARRSKR